MPYENTAEKTIDFQILGYAGWQFVSLESEAEKSHFLAVLFLPAWYHGDGKTLFLLEQASL
jgi:putative AlgH/UPF0301 family transcriptional regulator